MTGVQNNLSNSDGWTGFFFRRDHGNGFGFCGGRGHLGRRLALNIDHEPVGIRQQKGVVVSRAGHIEHHANDVLTKLAHTDLAQEPVIDQDRLLGIHGQSGTEDIDIDAWR